MLVFGFSHIFSQTKISHYKNGAHQEDIPAIPHTFYLLSLFARVHSVHNPSYIYETISIQHHFESHRDLSAVPMYQSDPSIRALSISCRQSASPLLSASGLVSIDGQSCRDAASLCV